MDLKQSGDSEARFAAYVKGLAGVIDIMKAHTAFGTQIFYSKWALGGQR